MRPSVLIVDDHEDFRRSARALLEAEGFAVVGEAGDGAEATAKVRAVRPDVVLVDIQLFGRSRRSPGWPPTPCICTVGRSSMVCSRFQAVGSTPGTYPAPGLAAAG
jgi:CheY-like chemotaxis protein